LLTLGFRIPDDMSLIGFDDIEMGRLLLPPLSTVAQDISALGVHAAELLLNPSELPAHARSAVITPRLVPRGSTAAPRERSAM
uniref:substrate-binding domain-containing protein n=1 Tax=Escherichia coli TaxID=562 RepID=UPI001F4BC965